MAEIMHVDNINALNAAILPILNGTVPFTNVEHVEKQHLTKEVFNNLLHVLYFGTEHLEHLTPEDWLNIKRLSTDWHFP
jgi:hypothetical protein